MFNSDFERAHPQNQIQNLALDTTDNDTSMLQLQDMLLMKGDNNNDGNKKLTQNNMSKILNQTQKFIDRQIESSASRKRSRSTNIKPIKNNQDFEETQNEEDLVNVEDFMMASAFEPHNLRQTEPNIYKGSHTKRSADFASQHIDCNDLSMVHKDETTPRRKSRKPTNEDGIIQDEFGEDLCHGTHHRI